jgi:hypothetical protein
MGFEKIQHHESPDTLIDVQVSNFQKLLQISNGWTKPLRGSFTSVFSTSLRFKIYFLYCRLRQIQDIWYGKDVANNLIEWFQAQFVGKLDNRTLVCTNIKLDNYLL